MKDWELPEVVNTDKAPTYAGAIAELKAEGKCPLDTRHRQVKYLNNVVEADHGKLKLLIRPVRGFKTLKTAYATIKGFEVMRALRKGQARMFAIQGGIVGEARIVERAFGGVLRRSCVERPHRDSSVTRTASILRACASSRTRFCANRLLLAPEAVSLKIHSDAKTPHPHRAPALRLRTRPSCIRLCCKPDEEAK